MLEMTYTLRLGQLLKITPDLKDNMWQKLKPEKPNINTKQISKPNVAILVETHFKSDIVVTLALGSELSQCLARLWAKRGILGVKESVKE